MSVDDMPAPGSARGDPPSEGRKRSSSSLVVPARAPSPPGAPLALWQWKMGGFADMATLQKIHISTDSSSRVGSALLEYACQGADIIASMYTRTPAHVLPKELFVDEQHATADMWAYGITLMGMLTGIEWSHAPSCGIDWRRLVEHQLQSGGGGASGFSTVFTDAWGLPPAVAMLVGVEVLVLTGRPDSMPAADMHAKFFKLLHRAMLAWEQGTLEGMLEYQQLAAQALWLLTQPTPNFSGGMVVPLWQLEADSLPLLHKLFVQLCSTRRNMLQLHVTSAAKRTAVKKSPEDAELGGLVLPDDCDSEEVALAFAPSEHNATCKQNAERQASELQCQGPLSKMFGRVLDFSLFPLPVVAQLAFEEGSTPYQILATLACSRQPWGGDLRSEALRLETRLRQLKKATAAATGAGVAAAAVGSSAKAQELRQVLEVAAEKEVAPPVQVAAAEEVATLAQVVAAEKEVAALVKVAAAEKEVAVQVAEVVMTREAEQSPSKRCV